MGRQGDRERKERDEGDANVHLILVPHGVQLLQLLGPVTGLLFGDIWRQKPGREPGSPPPAPQPPSSVSCLPMGLVSSEWGERTGEQKHLLHHTTQSCLGNEWKMGEEAHPSISSMGTPWVLGRMTGELSCFQER